MLNQVSLIDLSRPQRPLPSPRSLARANGEDRRAVGPTNFVAGVRGQ
jgi:hypothetical protein